MCAKVSTWSEVGEKTYSKCVPSRQSWYVKMSHLLKFIKLISSRCIYNHKMVERIIKCRLHLLNITEWIKFRDLSLCELLDTSNYFLMKKYLNSTYIINKKILNSSHNYIFNFELNFHYHLFHMFSCAYLLPYADRDILK